MSGKGDKTGWPADFVLTVEMSAYAQKKDLDALDEWEGFEDYHKAHGSKFSDWVAAWRLWCRNAHRWERERRNKLIGFTTPKTTYPVIHSVSYPTVINKVFEEVTPEQAKANAQKFRDMRDEIARKFKLG
jgi:hypothetical protein